MDLQPLGDRGHFLFGLLKPLCCLVHSKCSVFVGPKEESTKARVGRAWLPLASELSHREVAKSLDPAPWLRLPLGLWDQGDGPSRGMVVGVRRSGFASTSIHLNDIKQLTFLSRPYNFTWNSDETR